MIVEDEASKYPSLKVELFGSDLSERCLEKAQSGLYTQFEVQRGLPIRLLVRYFEKTDETWVLSPRIRQAVRWRRVNLLADLSGLGQFDVIFCRNVVSGFDREVARRVLEQLAAALPEDGRLILGIEETAADYTDALRSVSGRRGVYAPNPEYRQAA
jgi:chemotaxis protein methyltransferase CheR